MLRCVLLVSCFVLLVQAVPVEEDHHDHHEDRIEVELRADGRLGVTYHAPEYFYFKKVIFKVILSRHKRLREVDRTPVDHEDHEDWDVWFTKYPPFRPCDWYKIRVVGKGNPKVIETQKGQIPPVGGGKCPILY